jgi:tRNA modification GTPase
MAENDNNASKEPAQERVTTPGTAPKPAKAARDTIYAPATAAGRAAVAVVRISGPRAGVAFLALAGGPKTEFPPPRQAAFRKLRDPATGDVIDEALVLWLPGPNTETGEDMAELQMHGGRAIMAATIAALASIEGLRLAEPGEFARRSFDAGKLDLTALEGLGDLIAAETEAQRRQALRQMQGALGRRYEDWRERLVHALAHLEAAIDFPDEGLPDDVAYGVARDVARLAAEMRGHLDDARRGERLRDGIRVVLTGAPNVGKSSLFNLLVGREAAIVSPEAGTTRDVIEAAFDLAGYPVLLSDTAGLRDGDALVQPFNADEPTLDARADAAPDESIDESADPFIGAPADSFPDARPGAPAGAPIGAPIGDIEREGMRRARDRLADADIKLRVLDATEPMTADMLELGAAVDPDTILVLNKIDLAPDALRHFPAHLPAIRVSAATGEGFAELEERLAIAVAQRLEPGAEPALTRARHREAIETCLDCFSRMADAGGPELAAEDLRLAARALGRITGRVDVEDLLDVIFRDFCIGK